ncbi:MAG: GNAT family N-acetyltransferase [Deltaproteobacteria bacterium]|jgi:GNAT superfamily N-acetyltransferase|nr:GNAT family N-acetyltransferase [Deltaproteobacteria bacterium]
MKIRVIDNLKETTEPLSHSEAEKIAALIRQNTQDVNQGEYRPEDLERLNDFATPKRIQEEMKRGYLAMLLNDEEDLIGCALVVRRGVKLVIKTLQVKTDHCRKGYGSLLYKECENLFRRMRIHEIEVEVPKFPRSEAFYRSQGFVKTGNPTQKDLYFAMFKYV